MFPSGVDVFGILYVGVLVKSGRNDVDAIIAVVVVNIVNVVVVIVEHELEVVQTLCFILLFIFQIKEKTLIFKVMNVIKIVVK